MQGFQSIKFFTKYENLEEICRAGQYKHLSPCGFLVSFRNQISMFLQKRVFKRFLKLQILFEMM